MPRSYKICPVRNFRAEAFSTTPVSLDQQPPLREIEHVPVTTIRTSPANPGFEDFTQYVIEHDRVVKMAGRFGDVRFPEFTYTGVIAGFWSKQKGLLLLSGKKADVLSFCSHTCRVNEVQIDTLEIDMNALEAALPSVNLVWFKFKAGMIRASALMGANVEKTLAFEQARSEGEISTLSFYFEDALGSRHPVMVVDDGTVVLQGQYAEVLDELRIVTSVYERLIADLAVRVSPKKRGEPYSVSPTPA